MRLQSKVVMNHKWNQRGGDAPSEEIEEKLLVGQRCDLDSKNCYRAQICMNSMKKFWKYCRDKKLLTNICHSIYFLILFKFIFSCEFLWISRKNFQEIFKIECRGYYFDTAKKLTLLWLGSCSNSLCEYKCYAEKAICDNKFIFLNTNFYQIRIQKDI